jgi:hypothetical protein
MTNALNMNAVEERIAGRIDRDASRQLMVSDAAGGLAFANLSEVMEFAKLMAVGGIAVPKHLRGNPGACIAIVVQAIEWRLSPFAVANKSYSVNDRLAYEAQLVQAVILQRAPIRGRIRVEFTSEGERRVCRVFAELAATGEVVDYVSPPFGRITPKNSPLWKSDPDQQQFYYSVRALCRRHFPDVLLGVYAKDELEDAPVGEIEVMPPRKTSLADRLQVIADGGVTDDVEEVETATGDHEAFLDTVPPPDGGTEPVAVQSVVEWRRAPAPRRRR